MFLSKMLVEYFSIYVRILMTSMIYIRLENNAQVLDDHAPLKKCMQEIG